MISIEQIDAHEMWLRGLGGERLYVVDECFDGMDLSYRNLREADIRESSFEGTNLRGAILAGGTFTDCNFNGADLAFAHCGKAIFTRSTFRSANLESTRFVNAVLNGVDFRDADMLNVALDEARMFKSNLSGAKKLPDPVSVIKNIYETTEEGIICYKTFGWFFDVPSYWNIEEGSIITEVCDPDPAVDCSYGINVVPKWNNIPSDKIVWKCLIRWEWAVGIVVPYGTSGRIRCSKLELLKRVSYS